MSRFGKVDRSVGGVFKSFWAIVPAVVLVGMESAYILPKVLAVYPDMFPNMDQSRLQRVPGLLLIALKFIVTWLAGLDLWVRTVPVI